LDPIFEEMTASSCATSRVVLSGVMSLTYVSHLKARSELGDFIKRDPRKRQFCIIEISRVPLADTARAVLNGNFNPASLRLGLLLHSSADL
jgi:hypothetical protein